MSALAESFSNLLTQRLVADWKSIYNRYVLLLIESIVKKIEEKEGDVTVEDFLSDWNNIINTIPVTIKTPGQSGKKSSGEWGKCQHVFKEPERKCDKEVCSKSLTKKYCSSHYSQDEKAPPEKTKCIHLKKSGKNEDQPCGKNTLPGEQRCSTHHGKWLKDQEQAKKKKSGKEDEDSASESEEESDSEKEKKSSKKKKEQEPAESESEPEEHSENEEEDESSKKPKRILPSVVTDVQKAKEKKSPKEKESPKKSPKKVASKKSASSKKDKSESESEEEVTENTVKLDVFNKFKFNIGKGLPENDKLLNQKAIVVVGDAIQVACPLMGVGKGLRFDKGTYTVKDVAQKIVDFYNRKLTSELIDAGKIDDELKTQYKKDLADSKELLYTHVMSSKNFKELQLIGKHYQVKFE